MDNLNNNQVVEENELDLIELARKFWDKRKFISTICAIGLVAGVIIAISIPKEYTTTVILAPEAGTSNLGNAGALAATVGIDLNNKMSQELPPELYPDIAGSTPFLIGLLDVQVEDTKKNINTSLYTYLDEYQKAAWWGYVLKFPFKLISLFSGKSEEESATENTSKMIVLSKDQDQILNGLKKRIVVSVDKKSGVITLTSTMQSPEISAYIADTVISYLQEYVISYRTLKARQDLVFYEKLYEESKANYYKVQQAYASYIDENVGIISARYRTTQERLQNEMNLAYGIYNQMAQQLQLAKVKVQDTTPVYKIIQPAVVPLKASSPKKMLILIGFLFLSLAGSCGWVYMKDYFLNKNKG
ncbi:MAG: chain-length determining protein [Dysgonamonadaceae bacterium]|jgi:uncharacterized protein involved in exopolysaccharide biosynthesis|nr:chain-length determining protein [Dysgonamonadaceae bacterium]